MQSWGRGRRAAAARSCVDPAAPLGDGVLADSAPLRSVRRSVRSRVRRERSLAQRPCGVGDAVERDAHARGDPSEIASQPQFDGETAGPGLVDERGGLPRRRQRRCHTRLVVATELHDGPTQLLHAAPAYLPGRSQRFLGRSGIAAQHVPGARHLKHDGRQTVSDEVVDVTSDATPLGQQRLPGELAPGGLQLGRQLSLANEDTAEEPRADDADDPDDPGSLGLVLDQGLRQAASPPRGAPAKPPPGATPTSAPRRRPGARPRT
jgi:hypothetical protein